MGRAARVERTMAREREPWSVEDTESEARGEEYEGPSPSPSPPSLVSVLLRGLQYRKP